ncbi:MAG TPA: YdbL family protein [Sphingomicrobium sp.]|jgi:uncharacterized protein|nr:YdbL family protein [Sphingomicrobium sp.]
MRLRTFLLSGLLALAAAPAPAQMPVSSVIAARQAGQVGERFDGYLGFVVAPPATLRRQVEAINIRRRALYSNLAYQRSASPQEVGITAGCRLLARIAVGEAYMLSDGVWRRREAGQPAPVPSYCG